MLLRYLFTGCVAALLIAALLVPTADAKKGGGHGKPGGGGGNPAIAYVSWQSKSGLLEDRLMVMDVDGSNQTVVYKEKAPRGQVGYAIGTPSWSPDGTKIAFARFYDGSIFTIGVDGSGLTRLTPTPSPSNYYDSLPAWSPDGTEIAYTNALGICIINADGTNNRVTGHGGHNATWAPDGSAIAFLRVLGPFEERDVFVLDLATDVVTNITAGTVLGGANLIDVEWARTQDRLVVNAQFPLPGGTFGPVDTYMIDLADPTDPQSLGLETIYLDWSPDDANLVFQRSGGIYVVGADGTGETLLAETSPSGKWTWAGLRYPDWRR